MGAQCCSPVDVHETIWNLPGRDHRATTLARSDMARSRSDGQRSARSDVAPDTARATPPPPLPPVVPLPPLPTLLSGQRQIDEFPKLGGKDTEPKTADVLPPPPPPYHCCHEPERCALCLHDLAERALSVCTDVDGRRVCGHFFHVSCLRRVRPRRCPQCRASFANVAALPSLKEEPQAWAQLVALGEAQQPSKKEVISAFQAMLQMPPSKVESLLFDVPGWQEAADPMEMHYLRHLAAHLEQHIPSPSSFPPEDPEEDMHTSSGQHSHAANGEHSSSGPGEVCSCGRIHVFRGDRVRQGPAWNSEGNDVSPGQLGTVVRDEENAEAVFVHWDLAEPGEVRCYSWPADPSLHEVEHVPFTRIPRQVLSVQSQTGLSSVAASEYLRRTIARQGVPPLEDALRSPPQLYHRCRVLPEEALVQQMFDACPPCQCSRPDCRGGVRWNQQASRHLGREGYVLKVDERDSTVLVELVGRCNCKIWYPARAVQKTFDPDMCVEPRYQIGTHVECKIDGTWQKGTISRVWWRPPTGWGNRPTVPYSVKLEDGRSVYAPRDNDRLIRAAAPRLPRRRLYPPTDN